MLALVVFESFHTGEGGRAGDEFVGELGLVFALADFTVGVFGLVCAGLGQVVSMLVPRQTAPYTESEVQSAERDGLTPTPRHGSFSCKG